MGWQLLQGFSDQNLGIFVSSEAVKSFAHIHLSIQQVICVFACPKRVVNKNSSWDVENISHESYMFELSQLVRILDPTILASCVFHHHLSNPGLIGKCKTRCISGIETLLDSHGTEKYWFRISFPNRNLSMFRGASFWYNCGLYMKPNPNNSLLRVNPSKLPYILHCLIPPKKWVLLNDPLYKAPKIPACG